MGTATGRGSKYDRTLVGCRPRPGSIYNPGASARPFNGSSQGTGGDRAPTEGSQSRWRRSAPGPAVSGSRRLRFGRADLSLARRFLLVSLAVVVVGGAVLAWVLGQLIETSAINRTTVGDRPLRRELRRAGAAIAGQWLQPHPARDRLAPESPHQLSGWPADRRLPDLVDRWPDPLQPEPRAHGPQVRDGRRPGAGGAGRRHRRHQQPDRSRRTSTSGSSGATCSRSTSRSGRAARRSSSRSPSCTSSPTSWRPRSATTASWPGGWWPARPCSPTWPWPASSTRAATRSSARNPSCTRRVRQLSALLDQNAGLHARLRRAAARTTALNELERRRIGSDLHDGPTQTLAFAMLRLDALESRLGWDRPRRRSRPGERSQGAHGRARGDAGHRGGAAHARAGASRTGRDRAAGGGRPRAPVGHDRGCRHRGGSSPGAARHQDRSLPDPVGGAVERRPPRQLGPAWR